jgi:hypothetical protein
VHWKDVRHRHRPRRRPTGRCQFLSSASSRSRRLQLGGGRQCPGAIRRKGWRSAPTARRPPIIAVSATQIQYGQGRGHRLLPPPTRAPVATAAGAWPPVPWRPPQRRLPRQSPPCPLVLTSVVACWSSCSSAPCRAPSDAHPTVVAAALVQQPRRRELLIDESEAYLNQRRTGVTWCRRAPNSCRNVVRSPVAGDG